MKLYNVEELSKELNVSIYTVRFWYECQSKQLRDGAIDKPYLPEPQRIQGKGRPRIWTEEQMNALKKYQEGIVKGRNGIYGAYTNPDHFNTRKYKKQIGEM